MIEVKIENLVKKYGKTTALGGVSINLKPGTMTAVLGPSGCGKTTMLRAMGGFLKPDEGRIFFGDRDVTNLPPQDRGAALVFQNYALWPHMSVYDNIAYGLKIKKKTKSEIQERVKNIVNLVGLDEEMLQKDRKRLVQPNRRWFR
jgi:ABC-type sugar transport system ATPase subunit